MKKVLLPERNRKDVEEINQEYLKGLEVEYVKNMEDVLELALENKRAKGAKDLMQPVKADN